VSEQDDAPKKDLSDFINTWPLYSPFELRFRVPSSSPELPWTILRDCPRCKATPTWERKYPGGGASAGADVSVGVGRVTSYSCTHCKQGRSQIHIWYSQENESVKSADGQSSAVKRAVFRKLGQHPAQSIKPDREVVQALPPVLLELFKKGLTSLSQGYGIGALAYFRRVVEDGTGHLIELFAARAREDGDEAAAQTILAAKDDHHMEERLKVAADALPTDLRPGGVNPLAVLYAHYSRGLHGLPDNECLSVAQHLSFAIAYIFKNWRRQMEEASTFRQTVQKWSDPDKAHEKTPDES
jgi:hypothetical protein